MKNVIPVCITVWGLTWNSVESYRADTLQRITQKIHLEMQFITLITSHSSPQPNPGSTKQI